MDKLISTTDANREFSRIMGDVREGKSYLVTSRGKVFARITPVKERDAAQKATARDLLVAHLKAQKPKNVGRWTRDELYEDSV